MMLGFFKNNNDNVQDENFDPDDIKTHYEGGVMSAEYDARTLNRKIPDRQDFPYHDLYPHGFGKITYKNGDYIIEEYEGEFEVGQYQGKGKLTLNGEVFEGTFKENRFVEDK